MKYLSITFLTLLVILSAIQASDETSLNIKNNVTILSADNQSISMNFEMSDLEINEVVTDNESFDSYSIPGEGTTYEYGKPMLPAISRFVVVPPQTGLELRIETDEPRIVKSDNPPAICLDENVTPFVFANIPDDAIYPPIIAEMSEPCIIRGVRLVKVTTYPIRYNPVTNEYLHYENINTDIVVTDSEPVNPVHYPDRKWRSKDFLKYIESLAINGDQVRRDQPEDDEPPYVGHYCIAAHPSCMEYIMPFIEWRRKSGYKVDILNLTSGQAGNASNVKSAIQDLYDQYSEDGVEPFGLLHLIGDRASYSYAGSPGWQLGSFTGNSTYSGAAHADYEIGLLEGDDLNPDVGMSRWWAGSPATLELAVGRTLRYEANPYMENTDWFSAAGAFSQHWGNSSTSAWDIVIHTIVRWEKEVLEHKGYEDVRFYEWYDWDQVGQRIGPVLTEWFNDGMSIMIGRGELYNWRSSFSVNNHNVNPIFITMSGHGEWAAEAMTRNGSANNLMGPVNMMNGWGWNVIAVANSVQMEWVKYGLLLDLPMGWAWTAGITAFELYFPNNNGHRGQQLYQSTKTDAQHYGEPGIKPWLGVPRIIDADFPRQIDEDASLVEVYVHDPDDDDIPIAGAQVTFYAPGRLPDADEYAEYDDYHMMTMKSDAAGKAIFVL
ncbi:hypothetical protein K9N50_12835, partial [bacterium]|nr:hypothetical protein [bacterium]